MYHFCHAVGMFRVVEGQRDECSVFIQSPIQNGDSMR